MSRQSLVEYITALFVLYKCASKEEKTNFLNMAEKMTGKSRRTVFRYFSQCSLPTRPGLRVKIEGRGRQALYPPELLLVHIRVLWKAMEMISAERMKQALPKWLPFYKDPACTEEIRELLLMISRCTLERMLCTLRLENKAKRGLSTTSSGLRALKAKIPINTLDQLITKPGYTQIDTVAHCGNSTAGHYLNSLTMVDIFSNWTENRATNGKKAIVIRRALVDIKLKLPFKLYAVNSDSGSEFINQEVFNSLNPHPVYNQREKILFTRSRPYKKNDNCYVEQKNYTHVRQLFGYNRYEEAKLVPLMNEIYEKYWNPLHNFFLPSQKLIKKERVGAKITKKHDAPKTPADRLLESNYLTNEQKQKLREQALDLDPFELSKTLETKLKEFFELHRQAHTNKDAA